MAHTGNHIPIEHFQDQIFRPLYRKIALWLDRVIEPLFFIVCLILLFLAVYRLVDPESMNALICELTYPVP